MLLKVVLIHNDHAQPRSGRSTELKFTKKAGRPLRLLELIVMPDFEYYLGFWGEVENDNLIERDTGIKEKDFWFSTEKERAEFKAKLESVADKYDVIIAFKQEQGEEVRLRAVARMTMVLPDGKEFPYEYDFGYAYEKSAAEYMFFEGNYSCDCNKTIFLSQEHPEIKEWDCGDDIKLKDFSVTLEA